MANPYSSQSAPASYNQNAPADDGSEVSANEITWSKHKDKIGDPLKSFVESVNSAVSSAFGKIFGNAVSAISSGYTVQASDQGKFLSATNTITIDLLSAATAGTNFCFGVRNDGSGTVTLDGDGSETINSATTLALAAGDWAILVSDGTNWSAWNLNQSVLAINTDQLTTDFETDATTSHTVGDGDAESIRRFTSSSAITVTLPNSTPTGWSVGDSMGVIRGGTGSLTFSSAGTIRTPGGSAINTQHGKAVVTLAAAGVWELSGDL